MLLLRYWRNREAIETNSSKKDLKVQGLYPLLSQSALLACFSCVTVENPAWHVTTSRHSAPFKWLVSFFFIFMVLLHSPYVGLLPQVSWFLLPYVGPRPALIVQLLHVSWWKVAWHAWHYFLRFYISARLGSRTTINRYSKAPECQVTVSNPCKERVCIQVCDISVALY